MTIKKEYMHTGIPVAAKMDGMTYMEGLKVWIANNADYSIEYLYWERETPCAYRMVADPHVAYKVDDVDAAVKEAVAEGAIVLLPKYSLGGTCAIAYVGYPNNGPQVEFFQA